MLLVAPDPRSGIAPERIARVRVLLDAAPSAPGVAIAIPGGPDGVLDALVLRPDGVLGLVPGSVPARSGARTGGLGTIEGGDGTGGEWAGGTGGGDGRDEEDASHEVERLLALSSPAPTAPRRVVAVPAAVGAEPESSEPAWGARLALTTALGAPALAAEEVRRLFVALRLAEHVPGADALADAGFTTHPSMVRAPAAAVPPTAPVAVPRDPRAGSGRDLPRTGRLPAQDATPAASWGEAAGSRAPRRARPAAAVPPWVWTWRGLAVAAAAVFLVAVGGALVVVRTTAPPAAPAVAADPTNPRVVGAVTWERRAQTVDSTCDDHAYGLAAQFLRERACLRLDRSLWSGTSPQGPAVLAVSVVRMGDAQSASALKSLIDASGTGNLADLLREGRTFPGAPTGLTAAGYGSRLEGDRIVIVESDWLDTSRKDEPVLDQIARDAVDAGVGAG